MICTPNLKLFGQSRRVTHGLGHVTHMRDRRGAHRVLVGKHEGKRPLVRYRLR